MIDANDHVAVHYSKDDLLHRIIAALKESGIDVDNLTADDLAPVDAFHLRGRSATEELLQWTNIQSHHRVLDVGCGIGGTSRLLATKTGCHVIGVDLTADYCRIADDLSARVNLADKTQFKQGSATALPMDDDFFDAVWTEHVQMNIEDKRAFYGEIARVLKPGGEFAFHDIVAGECEGIHFPVPWAGNASISHLINVGELKSLLSELGFQPVRWEDKSESARKFLETALQRMRNQESAPLGIHLLMGKDAPDKFANVYRNLKENRIGVIQAVMKR